MRLYGLLKQKRIAGKVKAPEENILKLSN